MGEVDPVTNAKLKELLDILKEEGRDIIIHIGGQEYKGGII
jgi:hypothetical protein